MRMNKSGNNQEMLSTASYFILLFRLCLPSVIVMIVMIVYNMADTYFIGQTGNVYQLTAVSLCGSLFGILSGLGNLVGNGGCTVISLALGKKEDQNVKAVTSFCFYSSLAIGFAFMLIVLLLLDPIVNILGADEETYRYVCTYLRIIALGGPIILFSNAFANIIRADGAAAQSMVGNLAGTLTNIILDALFILVLSWGAAGAALATVLGNCVSSAYLFYYVIKKQPAFSLKLSDLSLKKEVVIPVITLGFPMACSTLLMSFSNIIANRMLVSYGAIAVAAQSVASKISMLTSMLAMGICMGMQPAISYNYGSQNRKRMNSILRNTGILTASIGVVISVIGFLGRDFIIRAFIDNEEVIALGRIFIFASLIPGPFYGLYQLCQTFLQSTGKASYATVVSLLDKGLFYLPILMLMNKMMGVYGVIYAPLATLAFSMAAAVFLSLRWNRSI